MVYVDCPHKFISEIPQAKRSGAKWDHEWCHMWADTEEELVAFAKTIGLKKEWLQKSKKWLPHYDLLPPIRDRALKRGAVVMPLKQWYQQVRKGPQCG